METFGTGKEPLWRPDPKLQRFILALRAYDRAVNLDKDFQAELKEFNEAKAAYLGCR